MELLTNVIDRRNLLKTLSAGGLTFAAGAMFGGCSSGGDSDASADNDNDLSILNFALNLEYLEAEYYLRALTGNGLSDSDRGSTPGSVKGGRAVKFRSGLIKQYATEIAKDEEDHVKFLRSALGSGAVSAPDINFTDAFAALGFDPFADETSFLLGAFVFEDVGVTAYNGAAPLIVNKTFLGAAASILAVEAYHSGNIRTALNAVGGSALDIARKISDARDGVNPGVDKDQPPAGNIVPTDGSGLAFARTATEVLNIVSLNPNTTPGGFFPNGINV